MKAKDIVKKQEGGTKMNKLWIYMIGFALMFGMVSAAGTFVNPTASSTLGGETVTINVTCAQPDTINASITASSTLTGSSLSTTWLYNYSTANQKVNASVDISGLTDATDWVFSGTCYATNGSSETITSVTATVDNTVPVCTWSDPTTSSATYGITYTWTVTGTNGTAGTLNFGSNAGKTMTESSDTFTLSGYTTEGTYTTVRASISDGTNTTTCDLNYITVDSDSTTLQAAVALAGAQVGAKEAQTKKQQDNMRTIMLVGVAAVAIYYFRKKRK